MVKNTADFCENCNYHGKETPSNHRPEDHYTVYKSQYLALTTIIICSARFSSVKFCHCRALTKSRKIYILGKIHISTMMSRSHIEPVSNKAKTDFGSRGKGIFCVQISIEITQ